MIKVVENTFSINAPSLSPSISSLMRSEKEAGDTLFLREEATSSIPSSIYQFFRSLLQKVIRFFQKTPLNHLPPQTPEMPIAASFETRLHTPDGVSIEDRFSNANKRFAYQTLTQDIPPNDLSSEFSKYRLENRQAVSEMPIQKKEPLQIVQIEGAFTYPPSNEEQKHWTANFADSHLFGFAFGSLLAQDELQVLEHPGLYHLNRILPDWEASQLAPNEAALIENILRLGNLDTTTPIATPQGGSLPAGSTLYGNNFARASRPDLESRLERLDNPHASHIFAMAAPRIAHHLHSQPYQKQDLEHLFYTAYTAFSAAKQRSGTADCILHTGNWGAGAFGNNPEVVALIQIAAAHLAQVDEVRYYPMASLLAFQSASQKFEEILTHFADESMSVDAFLSYITEKAVDLGFLYGQSNGT